MYKTNTIFNIPIAKITLKELPSIITNLIKSQKKNTIFYVNAHCLLLSARDPEYVSILQKATLVYSGGIGPVIASKILRTPLIERTPTPDFIFDIFKIAQQKKWSFYLLGSTDSSVKKAHERLKKQFPGLIIAGYHNGYFDSSENKKIIEEIAQKKPTILLVGMGSPKQEKWIYEQKDKLNVKAFWAVGALFDVISGTLPRAPKPLQLLGLEWLFRLLQEPKRLWKRYLLGNVEFLFFIIRKRFATK